MSVLPGIRDPQKLGHSHYHVRIYQNLSPYSMICFTCCLTPYNLAFPDGQELTGQILDFVMNGLFLIDIFVNFFSAYVNADYKLIDDRKVCYL